MKTTAKDVILLCKGWYDKEKYPTILDALKEYYRRYYSTAYEEYLCERFLLDTVMNNVMYEVMRDYPDRLSRFVNICLSTNLIDNAIYGVGETTGYKIVMFYRIVSFLSELRIRGSNCEVAIDMSDYFDENGKLKEDIV